LLNAVKVGFALKSVSASKMLNMIGAVTPLIPVLVTVKFVEEVGQ